VVGRALCGAVPDFLFCTAFTMDSARTPQRASSGLRALPLLAPLMRFLTGQPDAPDLAIHAYLLCSAIQWGPEKNFSESILKVSTVLRRFVSISLSTSFAQQPRACFTTEVVACLLVIGVVDSA